MSLLTRLILATLAASVAAECPMNFFESGNGCFAVVDQPDRNMTWDECRSMCSVMSTDGFNADLATFEDAKDLETFSITWLDVGSSFRPHPYMWIGVHKVSDEWLTINGDLIGFQNLMWHVGHPHSMGVNVFLEDITMTSTTGENSFGRLYFACSMGIYEHHSRCLCQARK